MTDLLAYLSFGGVCIVLGAAPTAIFFLRREEMAERRQHAPVTSETAPIVAPARHARRMSLRAAVAGVRVTVRTAVGRVVARISPTPAAETPTVVALPQPAPSGYAALDINTHTWPLNSAPQPAPPVGRVPIPVDYDPAGLDFAATIRAEDARLHRAAQSRLNDPDATGLMAPVRGGAR